MVCPFEPLEKQALLESADSAARADTLVTLLQMGAHEGGGCRPAAELIAAARRPLPSRVLWWNAVRSDITRHLMSDVPNTTAAVDPKLLEILVCPGDQGAAGSMTGRRGN